METNFNQLCVWPATIVGENNVKEFTEFMKDTFGVNVKYECEVKTLPGDGEEGGRNDVFFYISNEDVPRFAIGRLDYGIRWYEDVLSNEKDRLYPSEIYSKYKNTWREA